MSIIIPNDVMNTAFDSKALEAPLPELTIGVRDGNLLFTQPEQLLNRRRCRCFEPRSTRYHKEAIRFVKNKLRVTIPPHRERLSKHVKDLSSQIQAKLDIFFINTSNK